MGDPITGGKIRAARTEKRWTQKELADAVGLGDAQSVSNYERGVTDVPYERLQRIASVLGKPVSFFVDEPNPQAADEMQRLHDEIAELRQMVQQLLDQQRRKAS